MAPTYLAIVDGKRYGFAKGVTLVHNQDVSRMVLYVARSIVPKVSLSHNAMVVKKVE